MVTTSMTTKKVFRELLCVLEDWPLHSTSTCDGDQQDVLALAVSDPTRLSPRVASAGGSPSSPATASPAVAGNPGQGQV